MKKNKIISVFGTRPQYIKHAVLLPQLHQYFNVVSIDTTQHYDDSLSNNIIEDLNLSVTISLDIDFKSISNEDRVTQIKKALQIKFESEEPIAVITYGDTDSTIAAAKASKEYGCFLVHIEAGERSRNVEMPEEKNRITTDKLSDIHFCVSKVSLQNLANEGIKKNTFLVGDLMKELILTAEKKITLSPLPFPYYFCTIHRNYTQNNKIKLTEIFNALNNLDALVIFPIHPSTRKKMFEFDLQTSNFTNIKFIDPLNYSSSIQYQKFCKAILTDSGGIQKEAYWLKKKCITIRKETEWIETLIGNWNTLVYDDFESKIKDAINTTNHNYNKALYGNGNSGKLIAKRLYHIIKAI